MIEDYLGFRVDTSTLRSKDPMEYWTPSLEHWPELSLWPVCDLRAFQSRRMFCEKKNTVNWPTFKKINQSWIRNDYYTPAAGSVDKFVLVL